MLDRIGADTRVILVDVHAEATSDKQLLGRYLDGRVSAVLGTHTHVATADEQILKNGTAYQTDVGMTGPHDSILGRRYDRVLSATLTFVHTYFDVATGDPRLNGALLDHRPPDRPRPGDQPGQHRPGGSPAPADRLLDERGPPGPPVGWVKPTDARRYHPGGFHPPYRLLTIATLVVKI